MEFCEIKTLIGENNSRSLRLPAALIHVRLVVHQYRVGQVKRGQLTFLLVKSERIYKIKLFLAGINYIEARATSDVMPILC